MAIKELCGRVDDQVGTPFDRTAEIGRCKRVIDDQRNAGFMRDLRDCFDVHDDPTRIRQELKEDRLAAWRQRTAEVFGVGGIDEVAGPTKLLERQPKLRPRGTIEVARRDELTAG